MELMVINYCGEGGFRLQNGSLSVLINPPNNRLKADVVLKTETDLAHLNLNQIGEITVPGEYEVQGIEITGWMIPDESNQKSIKTAYLIKWEDISFVFLGATKKMPSAEILENFNDPSIVFVPFGGSYLNQEDVLKMVKQLEPAVVIPTFSADEKLVSKVFGQNITTQDKFVFKKKDLELGKMQVILLKENV